MNYYLRNKRFYLHFITPIVISILSTLYFSSLIEKHLEETQKVEPIKDIDFTQSPVKIIKQEYYSINYSTTAPIFDFFYLSCDNDSTFYYVDLLTDCLVIRYDRQAGSLEFEIPKDLMRQEQFLWPRISNPEIYNVNVGLFFHRTIPFQVNSEDESYLKLRVDVPSNESAITIDFKDKCSFLCYTLPRVTGYALGIFFATLILYFVIFWFTKKCIVTIKKKSM